MCKDENKKNNKVQEINTTVSDFNYEDIVFDGYEGFDCPKIAIIEYYNNSIVYEDYTELDLYLKNEFIPNNINKMTKKNDLTSDTARFYITLNQILDMKLSHREIEYVFNYLKNEGIVVVGRSPVVDNSITNYECNVSYKTHNYKSKFAKNDEEEIKLFELLRETNDKKIREKLILDNIRIAQSIARNYYYKYKIDLDELESYAYEGLCKAVDNFDYTLGVKFLSYAYLSIKGSVRNGVADIKNNYRSMRFNYYYNKVLPYVTRVEEEKNKKISEDQNLIEIVLELMIKDGAISLKQKDVFKKYIYSNLEISFNNDVDILIDDNYDDVINEIYNLQLRDLLEEIMADVLTEKEKEVIKKRFGLDGEIEKTLPQIGEEMSVTKQRIKQLEKRALEKLGNKESKEKLLSFLQDTIDSMSHMELYNYIEEDDYSNDFYDDNYDYKRPPRR